MIVVDTSALAAILLDEPEREAFTNLLLQKEASISAANLLELLIVMGGRAGERGVADAHALIRDTGLEIAAVDAEMALAAFAAHQQFGKGRHPAELNFGDCFSYALAKARDVPLLFKGDDFRQTDVRRALA